MNYAQNAKFIRSVPRFEELSPAKCPEVCILGRSNVGKSSFLNHVLSNRKLARVSSTPGKTQLLNLYQVEENSIWVDMPGYGYAKASKSNKAEWGKLVNEYCSQRVGLAGVIWLLDIRHPGQQVDMDVYAWLCSMGMPILQVYTKCDKLTRSEQTRNASVYASLFACGAPGVLYSTEMSLTRDRFWKSYIPWQEGLGSIRV